MIKLSNLLKESNLNEGTTDHFVVNSKDKKLYPMRGNSHEYWQGDKKGQIDMEIEVFGYNNKQHALEIYNALKQAGLTDKYFKISISPK